MNKKYTDHTSSSDHNSAPPSRWSHPRKIGRRVWEIGWGGSVLCTQNAGMLPIAL